MTGKDKLKNWKGELSRPKGTKKHRDGWVFCVCKDEREGVWATVNLPGFEL